MKKKWKIIIPGFVICIILVIVVIQRNLVEKTSNFMFYLEEKYYGNNTFIEIGADELEALVEQKESFAVFVHQPFCSASYSFNRVLTEFAEEHQISFYKIRFEDMEDSSLGKHVKYYPSFAIYYEGEVVAFLDAEADEDLPYYKGADEFGQWFGKYVTFENR